jgi:UDP-N-acetylglucosamine 4,6-dehydratase
MEEPHVTKFFDDAHRRDLQAYLKDKSVLITGGTGSFGNALVEVLLRDFECRRIIVFSRDELKQSIMARRFDPKQYPAMRYFLGDVRDLSRLQMAFRDVQIVFNAAALKQVPALEYNPSEAVKTNIMGAMNITNAAVFSSSIERVVHLSTDKAANPINLYGATKLCADKIFVAANNLSGSYGNPSAARFSVVRYGNVFGSRGSIVPILHRLQSTGSVGLTDLRMTRYNITVAQAIEFVLVALTAMRGGETFVPKLPSYRLPDVAEAITPHCKVKVIGRRPGEKLHELMVPSDVAYKSVDCGKWYIVCPDLWPREKQLALGKALPEGFCYTSAQERTEEWASIATLRAQYVQWCAEHDETVPPEVAALVAARARA